MKINTDPTSGLTANRKSTGRSGLFVVLAAVAAMSLAGAAGSASADAGISAPSVGSDTGTLTSSTAAGLTFSSSESRPFTFECSIDGSAWAACTSPLALTGLLDGSHSVSVRQVVETSPAVAAVAADPEGCTPTVDCTTDPVDAVAAVYGTSAADTVTWTVDSTAPSAPGLSGAPAGLTNSASASISISGEDGASFSCSVDGGSSSPCKSLSLSGLADGSHTVSVTQTDAAGNISSAATATWTVDATAPAAPQLSGVPSSLTNSTSASISISGEAGSTFVCSVDGGSKASCTGIELSGLADGSHSVSVRQTDAAGNSSDAATASWTVDSTAPSAPGLSGAPAGLTNSTSASISISGEDGASFSCSVDGGTASSCTSISLSGLADGSHGVSVTQTDAAGNTSSAATATWTVDATAPATPVLSNTPPSHTNHTSESIGISAESGATLACAVDGSSQDCSSGTLSLSGLADGAHSASVTATDAAGNTSSAATVSWNVDTANPVAPELSGAPTGHTSTTSATISFSHEDAATFGCSVDGGAFAACTSPVHLTGLADGPHSFAVRQTDQAGNTSSAASASWTVDTVAPVAPTLSGKPADYTQSRSASISVSAEDGASLTCSIDGGAFAACTSPISLSDLADGGHSVAVKATDAAGNTSSAASAGWTVDNVAPAAPAIVSGVPGSLVATRSASIAVTAEDNSSLTCSVDGGDYAACTSPVALSGLADGNHSISIKATDRAGNTGAAVTSSTWEVDGTAPVIALGGVPTGGVQGPAPASATNGKKPTWYFTLTDAAGHLVASTATCRVDSGATANSCTSPYQVPVNLSDGSHTLTITVADSLGNSRTYTNTFTVDTIAPTASIIDGPSGRSGASVSFRFGSTEDGSTFRCRATGANAFAWRSCNSTESLTGLSSGGTTLYLQATDRAGNQSLSVSRTWSVDATIPTTTINYRTPTTTVGSYPLGALRVGNGEFRFLVDDPLATSECRIDDEPWADCTSPFTYSGLGYGDHTFSVRSTNLVGTVGPTRTSSWTVAGEPDTSIGSKPDAMTSATSADFGFSSSYPGATFQCKLDGGSWTDCSGGTATYSGLGLLGHTFQVRALNQLGEADLTPATYSWSVKAIPDTAIVTSSPGSTFDTSLNVAFGSSYPGATFQCSLDGGAWAACTNPRAISGLGAGDHTFRVRAVNQANEPDDTPASLSWTVAAAETSIGTKPSANTTARTASFTFASTAPGSTFECKLDSAAWAACTSPRNLSDLALGSHTFQVRATKNGITDASPASWTWSVNAPETTIGTTKPSNPSTDTTPSFSFSSDTTGATFECKLDTGAWAACTSPKNYTSALAVGSHTFQVRANAYGAADATPATYTWTIAAPDTSITTKPNSTDTDRTPTFGFAATITGSTFECKIDSGSWKTCTSPFTVPSDLSIASHTFQVRASNGGLTDATPATYTWTIGCPVYPAVNVTSAAISVATGLTAQVNVQFAKPVAGDSTGLKYSLLLNGAAGTSAQKAAFAAVVKSIDITASGLTTKSLTSANGWASSVSPTKSGSLTLTITFKKPSGTLGSKTVTVNVNPACS